MDYDILASMLYDANDTVIIVELKNESKRYKGYFLECNDTFLALGLEDSTVLIPTKDIKLIILPKTGEDSDDQNS